MKLEKLYGAKFVRLTTCLRRYAIPYYHSWLTNQQPNCSTAHWIEKFCSVHPSWCEYDTINRSEVGIRWTCIKCGEKESENLVQCRKCSSVVCHECAGLSATEIRCVQLKKRILIFECNECRDEGNNILNEDKLMLTLQSFLNNHLKTTIEVLVKKSLGAMELDIKDIKKLRGKAGTSPPQKQEQVTH